MRATLHLHRPDIELNASTFFLWLTGVALTATVAIALFSAGRL